jgi:hypothetical protein
MDGVRDGVGVKVAVPAGVGVSLGVNVGVVEWVGLGVRLGVTDGVLVSVEVGCTVGASVAVGTTRLAAIAQPPAKPTARRTNDRNAQTHQRRMLRIYAVETSIASGTKGLVIQSPGLACNMPPSTK